MKRITRREFGGGAVKGGAAALLFRASRAESAQAAAPIGAALADIPARVYIDHEGRTLESTARQGTRFTSTRAAVTITPSGDGTTVSVAVR